MNQGAIIIAQIVENSANPPSVGGVNVPAKLSLKPHASRNVSKLTMPRKAIANHPAILDI